PSKGCPLPAVDCQLGIAPCSILFWQPTTDNGQQPSSLRNSLALTRPLVYFILKLIQGLHYPAKE
ncbi:MAG: hypothetical protein P8017_09395, partial [Deltaproteobacteria bacterium]